MPKMQQSASQVLVFGVKSLKNGKGIFLSCSPSHSGKIVTKWLGQGVEKVNGLPIHILLPSDRAS